MILSHKIRIYPTTKQLQDLVKACGVARYTYNWGLSRWGEEYKSGNKPNANKLKLIWNKEKPEWVYDSPKDANQYPFTNLKNAFDRFFKKTAKYPTYKKKRASHDSFYVANDKLTLASNFVRLPKIGKVRLSESLRYQGKIISAVVSRTADRWFVSVAVDVGTLTKPRSANNTIGVDLGIKHLATMSDGTIANSTNPLRTNLRKLKTVARQFSKKRKGSNNKRKAAMKLAKLHQQIADIRKDILHKLTTHLCRENQTIVIEDLNVKGMVKNHKLARAISDVGFGEFRRQLEYKKFVYDNNLIIASRWFPSTKTCNRCGQVKDMPLSERTYKCDCGYTEDRDINAAKNLCTLGLRETNACGHNGSVSNIV